MARPTRRALLVSTGSLLTTVTAGCLGLVPSGRDPPEHDCSGIRRPTPDAPDEPNVVEPASYSGPPSDPTDEGDLTSYVESFERAFRRNSLVREHDGGLVEFGIGDQETWTKSAPAGAGVAGIEYTFHYTDRRGTIADSGMNLAVYYVDTSVAVRAHERGRREDGTHPDPWEDGVTVACFD